MRTTLDLPDQLLMQAKITAVKRGISLRELLTDGLRLVLVEKKPATRAPLNLPVVTVKANAPILRLNSQEIAEQLETEEAEHALAQRR